MEVDRQLAWVRVEGHTLFTEGSRCARDTRPAPSTVCLSAFLAGWASSWPVCYLPSLLLAGVAARCSANAPIKQSALQCDGISAAAAAAATLLRLLLKADGSLCFVQGQLRSADFERLVRNDSGNL